MTRVGAASAGGASDRQRRRSSEAAAATTAASMSAGAPRENSPGVPHWPDRERAIAGGERVAPRVKGPRLHALRHHVAERPGLVDSVEIRRRGEGRGSGAVPVGRQHAASSPLLQRQDTSSRPSCVMLLTTAPPSSRSACATGCAPVGGCTLGRRAPATRPAPHKEGSSRSSVCAHGAGLHTKAAASEHGRGVSPSSSCPESGRRRRLRQAAAAGVCSGVSLLLRLRLRECLACGTVRGLREREAWARRLGKRGDGGQFRCAESCSVGAGCEIARQAQRLWVGSWGNATHAARHRRQRRRQRGRLTTAAGVRKRMPQAIAPLTHMKTLMAYAGQAGGRCACSSSKPPSRRPTVQGGSERAAGSAVAGAAAAGQPSNMRPCSM